jgi:DNA-binding transcriptional LysR family regulator
LREIEFSRVAERLHIGQFTLSKQVYALESQLGVQLFNRNHQTVEVTDAGCAFVEEAREAVLHMERAGLAATAVFNGADEILNLGKSAYTELFMCRPCSRSDYPFASESFQLNPASIQPLTSMPHCRVWREL